MEQTTKLQLLIAGLNALGLDTYDKKEKLVELILTLQTEQQFFGLTIKEKENVLRFLTNTLNLSEEQKTQLEEMGLRLYNASEWTVTDEQKDHLMDFGLNKLKLTSEQAERLTNLHPDGFKTFSLTVEQKNILTSLAPLTREDKYSEESLTLLKDLQLKPSSQTFLVQEEIIPDPYTAFETPKSSYLPLKEKFLAGEQKTLRKIKEIERKTLKEEEIKQNKLSILRSLMRFAERSDSTWNYSFFKTPKLKTLKDFNYSLEDWVEKEVIAEWQADILLTCGFKTLPKYNFFELLIFTVEKFAGQNWTEFLAANKDLVEEFEEYTNSLRNQAITINQTIWENYATSSSKEQRQMEEKRNRWSNHSALKELIQKQINQALGNWKPPTQESSEYSIYDEVSNNNSFGLGNFGTFFTTPPTPSTSSRYNELLSNLGKEEEERMRKKRERDQARKKLEEQELTRRGQKLSEKDRKLKEAEEQRKREKDLAAEEEKKLDQARRMREQNLREEQESYFNNQIKNLQAKQKAQAEALTNQKRENQIAENKKQAAIDHITKQNQLANEKLKRDKELLEKKTQEKLKSITVQDEIERQKILKQAKQREVDLENERKENERFLMEQKKRQETELEKVKEQNKRKMQEEANKLRIEKAKQDEEIRKIERERQAAAEKARQDLEFTRRKAAEEHTNKQAAINQLEQESRLSEELRRQKEAIERNLYESQQQQYQRRMERGRADEAATSNQTRAMQSILNYYVNREEFNQSFQGGSYFENSGYLPQVSEIFARNSSIKVNIANFFVNSGKNKVLAGSNKPWKYDLDTDLQKTCSAVGNGWYTKQQLEEKIKQVIGERF